MNPTIPLRPPVTLANTQAEPETILKVELDDRCFLFPDGKQLAHFLVSVQPDKSIALDAIYGFNKTRLPARFLVLKLEDARLFVRELIDAIYAAKPGFVLNDSIRITILVVANGYRIEFLRNDTKHEIFLSTSVIWRFVKALLMAVDDASPIAAN